MFNVGAFQVMMYMYWHVVLIFCVVVKEVLVIGGGGSNMILCYFWLMFRFCILLGGMGVHLLMYVGLVVCYVGHNYVVFYALCYVG